VLRRLKQRRLRRENDKDKKKAVEKERGMEEQVLESTKWAVDRRSVQIVVEDLEMRR
jgi:hypothetical protein